MGVDVLFAWLSAVCKSRRALSVSVSLDSVVCGSPILRECSGTRYLGTTDLLFRGKRDLLGPPDTEVAVDLGYAAHGSAGGWSLPLAGSTVVAVWVTCPVPRGNV